MAGLEATCAAAWWAERLRDACSSEHWVAIERFRRLLAEWLDAELDRRSGPVPLTTSDCGPEINIGDHAIAAGVTVGAMAWPMQAAMWVAPRSVYVHVGYNAPRRQLVP